MTELEQRIKQLESTVEFLGSSLIYMAAHLTGHEGLKEAAAKVLEKKGNDGAAG